MLICALPGGLTLIIKMQTNLVSKDTMETTNSHTVQTSADSHSTLLNALSLVL